jgi:hypothetical protein
MKSLFMISVLLLAPWSVQAALVLGDDLIGVINNTSRFTGSGGGSPIILGPSAALSVNNPNVGIVDFENPSVSLTPDFSGSLAQTIEINELDLGFKANVDVLTGTGDDTFLLNAITGSGLYTVNGGAANDILDLTALAGMLTTKGTEILPNGSIFQDDSLILNYLNIEEIKGLVSGPESPEFPESPSPIPVPAAVWLFGTALVGLVGFSKRRKLA